MEGIFLVEVSLMDVIWGIGLDEWDFCCYDLREWWGINWFG